MKHAASIFLALALLAAPALAQDARPGEDLEELEKRLKARQAEEARLRNDVDAREKELKELRFRLVETADALQDAEARIVEINAEMARLESEEQVIAADLAQQKTQLGDVLAALQSLERTRPPALLVAPDDAAEAARIAMLLADAAPELEDKAAALKTSLDKLREVRADLATERASFEKTNADIEDRRKVLAQLLARKQEERDVARRLATAAQKETAALAGRASSLRGVLESLNRLARSVTPRLKPPAPKRGQTAPDLAPQPKPAGPSIPFRPLRAFSEARGALKPPVVGRLTGNFGAPKPGGGLFEGVRYATAADAIVTAPYEASVVFARPWDRLGNLLVLDVGGGYHILLIGVGAFLVEEGQTVAAGEPVGVMSRDGTDAAPALDVEIRRNREPVNPLLWLSAKTGG